ncbi:MAG: hypothetical protein KF901_12625 [Myxococcales bacterium]|nr:hypothetical protein [Myxococcales bacterium]
MNRASLFTSVLSCVLGLASVGCGDDAADEAVSTEPTVGVLELPISLRHDSEPSNPVRVEISTSSLRLDGREILALDGGRVPTEERDGMVIPKLRDAIAAAPARGSATLRVYASTPYLTTMLAVGTLKASRIGEIGFAVRRGSTNDVGYLKLDSYDVRPTSDEPAVVPPTHQRRWDELAPVWTQMTETCSASEHKVDCSWRAEHIAPGGDMQITLFARGSGVKVELDRVRGPAIEAPRPGPALIDGIPNEPQEVPPTPTETAAFTWRFQAATQAESPIAATLRPLCGAQPCGVVMRAEGGTQTLTLLTFLGSAFPNGTGAPHVLFQVPER